MGTLAAGAGLTLGSAYLLSKRGSITITKEGLEEAERKVAQRRAIRKEQIMQKARRDIKNKYKNYV